VVLWWSGGLRDRVELCGGVAVTILCGVDCIVGRLSSRQAARCGLGSGVALVRR